MTYPEANGLYEQYPEDLLKDRITSQLQDPSAHSYIDSFLEAQANHEGAPTQTIGTFMRLDGSIISVKQAWDASPYNYDKSKLMDPAVRSHDFIFVIATPDKATGVYNTDERTVTVPPKYMPPRPHMADPDGTSYDLFEIPSGAVSTEYPEDIAWLVSQFGASALIAPRFGAVEAQTLLSEGTPVALSLEDIKATLPEQRAARDVHEKVVTQSVGSTILGKLRSFGR